MKEKIINKDGKIKQVPIEELDNYLADGWVLGRGKAAWNKGLDKSDPRVAKYSDAQRGKKITDETKVKISIALTGRKLTDEHIANRTKAQTGLKRSAEFKEAQRKRALGHTVSDETKKKISQKNKGKSHPISEETKQKISKHNSSKEFQDYQRDIKLKNGTINTSKPEELAFIKLAEKFGIKNVIRYYTDTRYPFECDFYIKSLDLFIELNYHWTHGLHQFNKDNPADLQKLTSWIAKSATSNFYKVAINVWTNRDVIKYETAIKNKLNYLMFYKIADFNKWLGTIK